MKPSILALAATMVATAATAQEIPQANNEWFTAAQDRIQQEIAKQPITNRAKNVIILIADGNGVGTNYATRLFAGQQAGGYGDEFVGPHEKFPYLALVKTYNTNAQTPDSAGTGTAMMAGVKTKAGVLGVNANAVRGDCSTVAGNELASISDILAAEGKSVGIISTARITHATPASAYSNSADRNWEGSVPEGCTQQTDIAQQLVAKMKDGTVDLAMGGGRRFFVSEGAQTDEGGKGRRKDGKDLIAELKGAGVQYAWNDETAGKLELSGKPILGLFEDSHMKYEADRADEPSLAQMTEMAIKSLSNNQNGFFLQIEAGRVDHANHAGNLARTVRDGIAFQEAIAIADELTNDEDTLIVVTADHEHAIAFNGYCGRGSDILGLCMDISNDKTENTGEPLLADDGKPYTVAGFLNGAGSVLTKQADGNYYGGRPEVTQEQAVDLEYLQQALIPKSSETHSGEDVAVYAKGPWAHLLEGTIEQNVIFHVMHHAATAN
ncbi:MAG: alkaline phosphatase [Rhodospirillales bacterium]|nr:alkaline phosphatase [Rhodospirillales bacterium]